VRGSTAALVVAAGFFVIWAPRDVPGFRLVLAHGWHEGVCRRPNASADAVSDRRRPTRDPRLEELD
jgi:hypothetical protein